MLQVIVHGKLVECDPTRNGTITVVDATSSKIVITIAPAPPVAGTMYHYSLSAVPFNAIISGRGNIPVEDVSEQVPFE